MPRIDGVCEDPVLLAEGSQVARWTSGPLLDEPEGHVKVGRSQGPIEDLALVDLGEEGVGTGEPDVVIEEPLLAFRRLELHTDAHLRPRCVEPVVHEALEDAPVNMKDIGRCPVPIGRCNQDGRRVNVLRLFPEPEVLEGLLHSLGDFAHLGHISFSLFAHRRGVRLEELWRFLGHEGHEDCALARGACAGARTLESQNSYSFSVLALLLAVAVAVAGPADR